MAPSILIVGATGNTGRALTETLPTLLKASKTLQDHRVIALTRSLASPAAQQLTTIPGVEVVEKNWKDINTTWLREHSVARAFIASAVEPVQFAYESGFHVAAKNAGVKYVVRISTVESNVRPDCEAYYPRAHWAIEAMLGSPEFEGVQWTSLQPNAFLSFIIHPAVEFAKRHRKTGGQGDQETLRLMVSKDVPVGLVNADDVGIFAAHLLAVDDPTPHNKAKYVLNGPEDTTGTEIVELVENEIGGPVKNVTFEDVSVVTEFFEPELRSDSLVISVEHAMEPAWEGKSKASTTSKEVLEIAAPKGRLVDLWKQMLEG
ncbi:hypothetical protein BJY01DRAFT_219155 [Aspergillus pseudoustus]|uniref:NmrA-like domain-containing protein n=1 Tax=Aspergillus pseudoustus TaxID=1810923 RepID=A0ABR4JHT7_9EURO